MSKKTMLLFFAWLCYLLPARAQQHPFQNTALSDDERLENLISLMTLEEKIDNMSPRPSGIPRLGIKPTRIMEGYHGLAHSGPANWAIKGEGEAPTTTFPQAIGLAQSWDTDLIERVADWEAYECRYLAQHPDYGKAGLIILAPNADLGRDVRWGRTEECYGEDAYLAAELTVAFVKGLQGDHPRYWKTAALMKHFLANSNENDRFTNSSDFDDRLFREYYSYPFYKGVVEGGSRAYMAAYNKYNGIPCAVHPMLKEITVDEWGQNGIICTDGGAFKLLLTAHEYYEDLPAAAAACIKSGITMFLDDYKPYLKEAIDKGMVKEAEIDEVLKGTLRVLLKTGFLDTSSENLYAQIGITDTIRPWTKPEAVELAREATAKSVVLLKNENQRLPLKLENTKSIAVIGFASDKVISDWYAGTPPYKVSVLDGIHNAVSEDVEILHAVTNKADSAVIAAQAADVAIVCIGNHPLSYGLGWAQNQVFSEGREAVDRQAITTEQEDLVKLVQAANPNTILVLVSSFPYAINWSKENVPAIVHISQSSQELGNGLADVLFGKISPAGKLVQTWPTSIEQLPPILEYNIRNGRTYMYSPHEPLFAFGHGLTYTTFNYSNLKSDKKTIREGEVITLSFQIKNTGRYDSDEVIQVYARYPDSKVERPIKELKAFKRIHLSAGEMRQETIIVDVDDLRYWDVDAHAFRLEKGKIQLELGSASDDIRLSIDLKTK